MADLISL